MLVMHKTLKSMFREMEAACKSAPIFRPSYLLLNAYYHYIRGRKVKAYSIMSKATECAKEYSHGPVLVLIEHTKDHWRGTLNPKLENYWAEHIEIDRILDYKDFDEEKGKHIVPYTLPLPKEMQR